MKRHGSRKSVKTFMVAWRKEDEDVARLRQKRKTGEAKKFVTATRGVERASEATPLGLVLAHDTDIDLRSSCSSHIERVVFAIDK